MESKFHQNNDLVLVRNFVDGDIKAFDALYEVYCPRLNAFILSLVKTESESEELTQEVFVKIWEKRHQLRKQGSFNSFLFTIAYNTTMSFLRKKASEARFMENLSAFQVDLEEPDVYRKIDFEEVRANLKKAIEKLPSRQKEVFELKHFQNLSYKEIARELRISVNTVENHMMKSYRILKEELKENSIFFLLFIYLFF